MKNTVETLLEQLDRTITDEQCEYLLFLYKHLHVEALDKKEQQFFADFFLSSEALQKMAAFAMALTEAMHEIQENMPAIEKEERLANGEDQRLYYERKRQAARLHQLKQQIAKKGNVFYVPFKDYRKELGPIIICLEQTANMTTYAELCKSMILPFFAMAYCEQRDLYIIPYNHQVKVHYRFENGHLNIQDFIDFIECDTGGQAAIMPVLQFAKGLLQENDPCDEAEVVIFTEGAPLDAKKLVEPSTKTMMQDMKSKYHMSISVVAIHEKMCNESQFWFADRAFYAHEYLQ